MKAYLINLQQARDRLKFDKENFSDSGFEPIVVKAIEGAILDLPNKDYDETSYRNAAW